MELGVLILGDRLPDPHTGIRNSQNERLRSIVHSSVEELPRYLSAVRSSRVCH